MGIRPAALMVSAVAALALAFAPTALGAHVETSPSRTAPFASTTSSGFVAFQWVEIEKGCVPCGKSRDVLTFQQFRFHDACTKSLTKIHKAIHVRNNRFSYRTSALSITGKLVPSRNSTYPRVKGEVRSDSDCAGDPGGFVAFDARQS